jgi:hypothetical protein
VNTFDKLKSIVDTLRRRQGPPLAADAVYQLISDYELPARDGRRTCFHRTGDRFRVEVVDEARGSPFVILKPVNRKAAPVTSRHDFYRDFVELLRPCRAVRPGRPTAHQLLHFLLSAGRIGRKDIEAARAALTADSLEPVTPAEGAAG